MIVGANNYSPLRAVAINLYKSAGIRVIRVHHPHAKIFSKFSEIIFYPAKNWHNQKMHIFDCLWFLSEFLTTF